MIRPCFQGPDHDILFRCGEVFPAHPLAISCSSLFAARQGSRSGRVAQLVEHSTLNRLVVGSIPTASTISLLISCNFAKTCPERADHCAYVVFHSMADIIWQHRAHSGHTRLNLTRLLRQCGICTFVVPRFCYSNSFLSSGMSRGGRSRRQACPEHVE